MKVYGTSGVCPKCGRQLHTSDVAGYGFVCKGCDENFYAMEVTDCMADFWEVNFSMAPDSWKRNLSELRKISEKYDCDFLGYDDSAKIMDIGWEKCFPESNILNKFVDEIEKIIKKTT